MYKNILKNPTIELQVSVTKTTAKVLPIIQKKRIDEIVHRFRTKYGTGDVKKYYQRPNVAIELSI